MNHLDFESKLDMPVSERKESDSSLFDIHQWQSEIDSFVSEIATELDEIAQLLQTESIFNFEQQSSQTADEWPGKPDRNIPANPELRESFARKPTNDFQQSCVVADKTSETELDEQDEVEQLSAFAEPMSTSNHSTGDRLASLRKRLSELQSDQTDLPTNYQQNQ